MRCKVLLRAVWKNMFCVPDFEKVSPAGENSDWVKETHCCKSGMEVYFSLVYDFLLGFYYTSLVVELRL